MLLFTEPCTHKVHTSMQKTSINGIIDLIILSGKTRFSVCFILLCYQVFIIINVSQTNRFGLVNNYYKVKKEISAVYFHLQKVILFKFTSSMYLDVDKCFKRNTTKSSVTSTTCVDKIAITNNEQIPLINNYYLLCDTKVRT